MQKFRSEFEELEDLYFLDCAQNSNSQALHYVQMDVIQEKLDSFKHHHNNHPLRTENNKTLLQSHASSALTHEAQRIEIDLNSMNALNEWMSNNNDVVLGNEVNVDAIHQYEFSNDMMIRMQNVKNSNDTNKLKHVAMRDAVMSIA